MECKVTTVKDSFQPGYKTNCFLHKQLKFLLWKGSCLAVWKPKVRASVREIKLYSLSSDKYLISLSSASWTLRVYLLYYRMLDSQCYLQIKTLMFLYLCTTYIKEKTLLWQYINKLMNHFFPKMGQAVSLLLHSYITMLYLFLFFCCLLLFLKRGW